MKQLSGRLLSKLSCNAILVSANQNILFLTGFDGFCKGEREAYLLLTKQKNYIFTDGRYTEAVKKFIPNFKLIEISPSKKFTDILKEIVVKEKIKKIAIDEDDISVKEFLKIKKIVKVCSDKNTIQKLREIKKPYEVSQIKKACRLGDLTFKHILAQIKTGITEQELSKKIEMFILSKNASISFAPIVAFGDNSSSPHHVAGSKKLQRNETVLLDFGVKINNYCSDMTRTIFFGKATDEQKRIYETVLEAQNKAIKFLESSIVNRKSIKCFEIDSVSRRYIISQGFPSIPHSLGHGIGLEVHENPRLSPKSDSILKKGMVFSIEPGIYIPGFGGVRIEDLVFYDGKNPQLISRAKKQIIEL